MCMQHRLDLRRIDVYAARDDHVDAAVADVVVAFRVPVGDVADREEAVMQALASRVRAVVVLGQPAVADHELARLAVGSLLSIRPYQPDLLSWHCGAARAGLSQL